MSEVPYRLTTEESDVDDIERCNQSEIDDMHLDDFPKNRYLESSDLTSDLDVSKDCQREDESIEDQGCSPKHDLVV
jgi:hypothetical protein